MNALRHLCLRHQGLAALIVAAALLMKVLVPAGFMPVFGAGGPTLAICTGFGPQEMTMAMPGMADHEGDHAGDHEGDHLSGQGAGKHRHGGHGGREMPCGFGGLAWPSLAAADPVLLTLAIAFIVATVFRAGLPIAARGIAHLRPPLRGPPRIA